MENKYYTPDITEFHVGFECEFFNNMQDKVWNKVSCDTDHLAIAFTCFEEGSVEWDDHISQTFRVKYLDRSDVELLGWELDKERKNPFYVDVYEHKDNKLLVFRLATRGTKILITVSSENFVGGMEENTVFEGKCKNTSELKKLMKQLNIV